jgi:hypothetical protein
MNKEKLFESVLREAKSDAVTLGNGYTVWFVKGSEKDAFDLAVEKDGKKGKVKSFAFFTEGYDQQFGNRSSKQYYLKTISDYSAGNGQGTSSKRTPLISHYRYLSLNIERYIDDGDLEIDWE